MAAEPPPDWARPVVVKSVATTARPTPLIRPPLVRSMVAEAPVVTERSAIRRSPPAAPPRTAAVKHVETRRPLHIPVIVGISAGLYAGCLYVTSGLQFAADRQLIADRQPMADAIGVLQRHREDMTTALTAATGRYNEAVAGYSELSSGTEGLQQRLARLNGQIAAIEGITIIRPSLDWSIADVLPPPGSTPPKATGATPRSSVAAANPPAVAPAAAVAQPRAVAPAPAPAPAPVAAPAPPPVAATTGASGKP